ncbi:hypothetical protein NDU88_003952 [Pleurodeles waltl]|uniref:Uncharacterized protein n=1 Tax=Pleurodeles waltl TaxID=8319 RepID=A0AAV7V252_PLEWA|nr:hypothetical protein NDU88_003952 [Pleurodeles waltl]
MRRSLSHLAGGGGDYLCPSPTTTSPKSIMISITEDNDKRQDCTGSLQVKMDKFTLPKGQAEVAVGEEQGNSPGGAAAGDVGLTIMTALQGVHGSLETTIYSSPRK